MTSELQRYPDVDFIGGSKDYQSTACLSYTAGIGAGDKPPIPTSLATI